LLKKAYDCYRMFSEEQNETTKVVLNPDWRWPMPETPGLAVVTRASTGIGYELAKCCAKAGFDLIVAADEAEIEAAAEDFRAMGSRSRRCGPRHRSRRRDALPRHQGPPVEALLANAGRGLGQAFLDLPRMKWGEEARDPLVAFPPRLCRTRLGR